MRQLTITLILIMLAIPLFLWGANKQGVLVNTNIHSTDQSAYVQYAKKMALTNLQQVGGRNRMPIYPGLMSFLYKEKMSNEDFFQRGKAVGIIIALVVACIAFFLFRQVAPPVDAAIAILVVLFTVFAYKAPYFQTEVLFYGISLVLFYLILSLLRTPKISTATLAGIIAGIGHLTKASVLPALLLACLCLLLRGATSRRSRRNVANAELASSSRVRHLLVHICYAMILLGCFLIVVFPYLQTSKERFGHYFYNVNSTFYIWCDSWEEVKQSTRAHGDRLGWPDMPKDQIPSFRKYLREHSLQSIGTRFFNGLRSLHRRTIGSYGYANFLAAYILMVGLFFGQNLRQTRSILIQTSPSLLLFIPAYFLGYLLLYAWYAPIAGGNRFVLSLFLPALFVLLSLISRALSNKLSFVCFKKKISASVISPLILLFLLGYILTVFPHRVSTMYGGH